MLFSNQGLKAEKTVIGNVALFIIARAACPTLKYSASANPINCQAEIYSGVPSVNSDSDILSAVNSITGGNE